MGVLSARQTVKKRLDVALGQGALPQGEEVGGLYIIENNGGGDDGNKDCAHIGHV